MNFNLLIARAKAILLTPASEWPVIAAEPATVAGLYKSYIAILAAIAPLAAFLRLCVLGVPMGVLGTWRVDIGTGLTILVTSYLLGLLAVYLLSLLVNALAPTFNGQKDPLMALKVVAYACTAAWIAGIGQLLPMIGSLLGLIGGIYTIYLLYLGLPVTMKCPQDKAVGYTVVTVIGGIVLGAVVAMVARGLLGPNPLLAQPVLPT